MSKELIIGEHYTEYGKYIGITRCIKYDEYDYKEHRFSIQRGVNVTAHINSVRVDDIETIETILTAHTTL